MQAVMAALVDRGISVSYPVRVQFRHIALQKRNEAA
jgi:hypothetical protein